MNCHDDGDRRRGAPGRFGRGRGARDDDVHFEANELAREGGESVSVVAVESTLDEHVLALDVPQLPHPLEESLPGAPASRAVRRGATEKAYAMDFRGLLRLGCEGHGEEAAGERAKECPPRGHCITHPRAPLTAESLVRALGQS